MPEHNAQLPETQLVARAKQGDFDAFESLVDMYERRVYSVALGILRNRADAEDVAQSAFLTALENLDAFREDSSFGTWLTRIAVNDSLKVLRSRRRKPTVPLDTPQENGSPLPRPDYVARWKENPEGLLARRDVQDALDEEIELLPEHHRLVFLLRDVDGLTTRETADALGITESNVKVRLLRARLQLRETLTHRFGDEASVLQPHEHDDHQSAPAAPGAHEVRP